MMTLHLKFSDDYDNISEAIRMSRKITWVIFIGLASFALLSVMVYRRQSVQEQGVQQAMAQPQSQKIVADPAGSQTPNAVAQKVLCSLNNAQAPDIAGLRLGMTSDEVLGAFPGSRDDPEVRPDLSRPPAFGVIRFVIRPDKYETKAKFAGIHQITFTIQDGRVSDINAGYNGPEWKNVDEFVAKFSEGRTLPAAEAWEAAPGMDTQLKALKCEGFEINVFAGGRGGNANYIQLRDLVADKELRSRRAKAREKAEKEAKPQ